MNGEAKHLGECLRSEIQSLAKMRDKVESLVAKNGLTTTEAEKIYEAIFLSAFTRMESTIEDLFIGLVSGKVVSSRRGIRASVSVKSKTQARLIVAAGRPYVDWFPIKNTLERATLFLNGGRPFSSLTDADKSDLAQMHRIRNAIAHRSGHALISFRTKVIGNIPLLPRERRPASFLRSIQRANPQQTRLEFYLVRMTMIISGICN